MLITSTVCVLAFLEDNFFDLCLLFKRYYIYLHYANYYKRQMDFMTFFVVGISV